MIARLIVLAATCLLASGALAQTRPPAAPAKPAAAASKAGSNPLLPGGNSKDPINIDAQKLEWFDAEQKAVYSGDVVVVQGEGSLKATVLTIFLQRDTPAAGAAKPAAAAGPAGGSSQIRRMEATGPVTVVQKDQVGTGDSGVYDKTQNKVFLIGNVTLSRGQT